MTYFDYAATTPIDKDVYETYKQVGETCFFNSGCNKEAKALETKMRSSILNSLNVDEDNYELVFTSGGTEANNISILGFAKGLKTKSHFITSCFEHASVNSPFKEIEQNGHSVTYVDVDENGHIDVKDVISHIKDNTVMVSIMLVNNELGTRQPVEQLFKYLKANHRQIVTMTDYVQGLGKLKFDHTHTDIFTISSHKIYGPKAVGAIIKKKDVTLKPLIVGGTNEFGMRAGLQSLPAQVAFARAVDTIITNFDQYNQVIYKVQSLFNSLVNESEVLTLNCVPEGNVSSIRVECNIENSEILDLMEGRGFYLSARSADSAGIKLYSRSLLGIGLTKEQVDHTMRVSFSHHTTEAEVRSLVENLEQIAILYQ